MTLPHTNDSDDWETENQEIKFSRSCARDLAKGHHIKLPFLNEEDFDTAYGYHRLPKPMRRFQKQVFPVIINNDKSMSYERHGVYVPIHDVLDAYLLLKSQEPDVVLQALETLIFFTENSAVKVSAKGVQEASLNQESPTAEFEEGNLAVKKLLAAQPGFLCYLLKLLRHPFGSIRRRAIILFGSLTSINETVEKLEKTSWIQSVSDLIDKDTESVVLDWLMEAIKNTSVLTIVRLDLFKLGCINRLLDLVMPYTMDPDVVENVMIILTNCCAHYEIREYIVATGGTEPACEWALSEYPNIQFRALVLIRELLIGGVSRAVDKFHEADGMRTILTILKTVEYQYIHFNALEILAYLMGIPSIASDLAQQKVYDFLLDMATSKKCKELPQIQAAAMRCVANAAKFPAQRLMLYSCEAEPRIMMMLAAKDSSAVAATLECISQLAKDTKCRKRLLELGVIKQTANHLTNPNTKVVEWAFRSLTSLILQDASLHTDFTKEGLPDHLRAAITDVKNFVFPSTLQAALSFASALHASGLYGETISQYTVPLLADMLSQPHQGLRLEAVRACIPLIRSEDSRSAFLNSGGFIALGRLFNDALFDELVQELCLAISVLATTEASIAQLASSGCMESVKRLRSAGCPVTKARATLVLDRICSLHPALKLCLTRRLSVDDRIGNGFCDTSNPLHVTTLMSDTISKKLQEANETIVYVSLPRKSFGVFRRDGSLRTTTGSDNAIVEDQSCSDRLPIDRDLESLIELLFAEATTVVKFDEELALIARIVSAKMGGPVTKQDEAAFLSSVPKDLNDTMTTRGPVIPIGAINKGAHWLRALLFKTLADRLNLPVSLVKTGSGHGWNEVTLVAGGVPAEYVVDLVETPGTLLKKSTKEAEAYMKPRYTNIISTSQADGNKQKKDRPTVPSVSSYNNSSSISLDHEIVRLEPFTGALADGLKCIIDSGIQMAISGVKDEKVDGKRATPQSAVAPTVGQQQKLKRRAPRWTPPVSSGSRGCVVASHAKVVKRVIPFKRNRFFHFAKLGEPVCEDVSPLDLLRSADSDLDIIRKTKTRVEVHARKSSSTVLDEGSLDSDGFEVEKTDYSGLTQMEKQILEQWWIGFEEDS